MNSRSANRCCLPWLLLPLWLLAASAGATQRYDYQVTYRGVFSLGEDMPIAELALSTKAPDDRADLQETRLEVSSQAYPVVETLYPIRYRFRSWRQSDDDQTVAFESFEKTDKRRHRLYLRDDSTRGVRSLDMERGDGADAITLLAAGVRPDSVGGTGQLFDRLGLLQQMRARPLQDQAEYRVPVATGRERLVYRVKVEGAQTVEVAGRSWPAWKLRFDGYEVTDRGDEQAAHRPVYIWLSRDDERVPLRADARHAVGLFRIELREAPGASQIAQRDP